MKLLPTPTAALEFDRQPVQEFGMRGPLSTGAEVFDRIDQTSSKKGLPISVHHHACRQRILFIHQPACEGKPIDRL